MAHDADDPAVLSGMPRAVLLAWGATPEVTKGPKPRWSLDQILDTAVRLGDDEGIEAITMSGVAKALGSATMSLYRYVESREDLLVLAADRALGGGNFPAQGTVQDRIRGWVRDLRRTYEQHPWLVAMPVGIEPLLPSYLRRLESGLACLESWPVSGTRAITVLTMLWTYTRGDVEQARQLAEFAGNQQAAEVNDLVATRLRALAGDAETSRVLAALEDDPAPESDSDEFDAAVDLVIAGLRAALDPAPGPAWTVA